ncbi:DUF756 domain-containing protein [Flavobacteriaceae bacterium F89]|uniref:DUF756 domain-containing protein n=1 Tax=Cerina litoralis TaxID=2874477 RepID=A0AAE3EXD7_9FLAO|nr:phospholipase domain-containing protein [Cerina litoralis]MCG2462890.1 DUF756 domain-containing protein [Cerina litoralis]
MPETSNYPALDAASKLLPLAAAPANPAPLYQEKGTRYSRALPYRLNVHFNRSKNDDKINLIFENGGDDGAVCHVYDLNHLDRIPRRYTVEAGKSLADDWKVGSDQGSYDLEVYGPNGYFHKFSGNINSLEEPEITLDYDYRKGGITVDIKNPGNSPVVATITSNAYDHGGPWEFRIAGGKVEYRSHKKLDKMQMGIVGS